MKKSKISYILMFVGIASVLLVALYLLVGRSVFSFSSKMKSALKAEQTRLQEIETLIRTVPNPQKAAEEMSVKAEEFKAMGYNKKQIPRLVQLLAKKATESKVTVVSIRPREDLRLGKDNLPPGVNKVFIEMVLKADYRVLSEFISSLDSLPFVFVVESLSLSKKEQTQPSSGGTVEGVLLASTFMVWDSQ